MKKHKKNIRYFLSIAIVCMAVLPIINWKLFIKEYDLKKLFNTDIIEQYFHYSVYTLFESSFHPKNVIVGKDGMLFLGNDFSNIVHNTQGLYKRKSHKYDVSVWTEKLKNLQEWYKYKKVQFTFVIAPNKHTIYQEKLPKWSSLEYKTVTEYVSEESKKKNIHLLNLKQKFRRESNSTAYYLNTDTHWNNRGAAFAFEKTIHFLNMNYKVHYTIPKYTLLSYKHLSGDLARLLKIKYLLSPKHEENFKYVFEKNNTFCHGTINKKLELETCEMSTKLIRKKTHQSQYVINSEAPNDAKVLFLCDSFGDANMIAYSRTFNTVFKIHYNHLFGDTLKDFVDNYKPDIVIYQVVERKLYDENIVTDMNKITRVPYDTPIKVKDKIFDIHHEKFMYKTNKQFVLTNSDLDVHKNDPVMILNQVKSKTHYVVIAYEIEAEKASKFQLFYKENIKDEYKHGSSYTVKLNKGKNNIKLVLPAKFINHQLRVDLVNTIGLYSLTRFTIHDVLSS